MAEEDASKIPVPQDEADDAATESNKVQVREPDMCHKRLMKDFTDKYF
jgi:hypothetical protein